MKTKIIFLYLVFNSFAFSFGQKNISCGLGVVFLNSPNIVDYVSTYGNKINEFENFPEFKIAIAIPIEDNLNLNGEFSYLFSTFNSENIYPISHEIKFFLPTIMLQKVFEEQLQLQKERSRAASKVTAGDWNVIVEDDIQDILPNREEYRMNTHHVQAP